MTITQSFSKLSAVAAGIAVAFALIAGVYATATPARAASLTSAQVSSIISLLQSFGADAATIANVQASLTGGTPTGTTGGTTGGTCPALSRSLQSGSTGADVKALQVFLNAKAATQVSVSGAGSPGLESTYFGPATKAAVTKFQTLNGVDAIGIVGPATRAAIAAVCGGTTGGTGTTPTGPGLTVSASAQPANALAPAGASRVPFTTFTVTNNSGVVQTINGVTVTRTGFGVDSNFAGVVLVDATNNIQLGTSRTLDSNHQATVGDTFTINPGETKTLTVAGNIAASNIAQSGQIVSLQVVAVNSTAAVNGVLPISGASHTINTNLTLGTANVYVSSFDPQSAQTKNIGDAGVKISGVRITAGSQEDLKLYSIRFRLNGSVGSTDLSNVMVNVDGTSYPAVVSTDGRYYTTSIPGGLLIGKGLSKEVYVQADFAGSNSAGRTIELDIDRASDIYIVGQLYNFGITPTAPTMNAVSTSPTHNSSFTTGQPFFQGAIITISGGSVTSVGRATEVPAQNVAVNVPSQVLGGFVADIKGEPITVQTMKFNVAGNGTTTTNQITNVTLVDENGSVKSGPVDAVGNVITFNSSVTFATGRHVYTIKGTIPTAAANGGTFTLSTNPGDTTLWTGVVGQNTGNTTTFPNGSFTLNTVTVRGATLNITAASTPGAQAIVAGGQSVVLANIQLDASQSGENVRINQLPVNFTNVTGLSACQLYNGSAAVTTGNNVPSNMSTGITTFTFDNPVVVTKGAVTTLTVKCNLSSSASGAYSVGVITSGTQTYSATGVQSGSSLTNNSNLTASTGNSGTQTVGASAFAVTNDSSSPSYSLIASGATGVVVGALNFAASGEAMSIQELGLTATGLSAAAASGDIVRVHIMNGSSEVGSVIFTSSSATATSTLSTPVTVPVGSNVTLTLKADVASIGIGQSGTSGDLIAINFSGARATGINSGSTTFAAGSSASAGARLVRSYPTVAQQVPASTNISGASTSGLIRFSVTANAAGQINLQQFAFSVSTSSGLTLTNVNLYAYNDSTLSTAANGTSNGLVNSASFNGASFKITANGLTNGSLGVSPNQTIYFVLRGSVSGSVSGSAVSTTLLGDSAFAALAATSTVDSSSNFVWSPNSTTTPSWSQNDWTSGYGVPGLPAASLTQTLTQ